jgi:ribonuclease HI
MKPTNIIIHTDGGARGNPGPAAIGAIAEMGQEVIFQIPERIGDQTNNVAEYTAVLRALEELDAISTTDSHISFVLDSELVVKQITGIYKVKQPHLRQILLKIHDLMNNLKKSHNTFGYRHVKREMNKVADSLVNQALDQ